MANCVQLMSHQLLRMLITSSSRRFFSRLAVTSTGNKNKRLTYQPSMESLGLDPMVKEIEYLWSLRNAYSDGDVKNSLLNDNSFKEICGLIMKKLRYMRPEQIRSLAHLVLGINLPTNIGITKGAIQMLRVHLNEYDAKALSDIYLLLKKNLTVEREDEQEPSNPNVEALLVAIPKALAIKIVGKQLTLNPDNLLTIFKASTSGCIDINAIIFLLKVIKSKIRFMDAVQLNTLTGLLCHPHIESNLDSIGRPLVQQILTYCWLQIAKSLCNQNVEIDYYFDETIRSLSTTSDPIYYNPSYCDTIYSIYDKSDSFENLNALDEFLAFTMKYNHYSIRTLEKISSLIISNPKSFLWETQLTSANIVQILGRLNWKPKNVDWNVLRTHLFEDLKLSGSPFYSPIGTRISLLILKEYEAFEHLSEQERVNMTKDIKIYETESPEIIYSNLITLNIGICCEAQELTIESDLSTIIPKAIEHLNSIHRPSQFQQSLNAFLKLTFGIEQKVVNNVWTSHGHFIDNLLMINKNGQPIGFDYNKVQSPNGIRFLDDYRIDPEAKLIAVIPLTDNEFNVKPYKLKGSLDLKFRTLEQFHGIKILRVHLQSWECLSDREKCAFLLREFSETIGQELDKELIDRVNCY